MSLSQYKMQRPRASERAAEAEAEAARASRELLSVARELRSDFRTHAQQRQILAVASDNAVSLLEEIETARASIEELMAAPAAPEPLPGEFPGALSAMPALYPGGPTPHGWLKGQLDSLAVTADAAVQRSGDAMTGDLSTTGKVGVGIVPTHRLHVRDTNFSMWWEGLAATPLIGSCGLHFDKVKTNGSPTVLCWHVGSAPTWELGQDYDTNNSSNGGTGDADLVLAYHWLNNGGVGADNIRISSEDASSLSATVKIVMARIAGTPRNQTEFLMVDGGDNAVPLSGATIRYWDSGTARNALNLTQRHGTSKRCIVNFNSQYLMGTDLNAAGTQNFWLYDNVGGTGTLLTFSPTGEAQFYKSFVHSGTTIGFLGAAASARQTVTGAKGGNAALADLIAKLVTKGLITDGTTA